MKRRTTTDPLQQFNRIFYHLANKHWRRLPARVKVLVDIDDLYQEACHHAVRILPKYDPTKAQLSTFLYGAINNRLNSVVTSYVRHVLDDTIDLDAAEVRQVVQPMPSRPECAEDRVHSMLVNASPRLLQFLRRYFFTSGQRQTLQWTVPQVVRKHQDEIQELLGLAQWYEIGVEDLLAVQGATLK